MRKTGMWMIFASALVALAQPALSQGRPDVRQMPCDEARTLVQQSRGIVVTTGDNSYQRYVPDGRFCDAGERFLHPAFTPTADKRSCRIGYTCESWDLYSTAD